MGARDAEKTNERPFTRRQVEVSAFLDPDELVRLARRNTRRSRGELFAAIGELFSDTPDALTERDRAIMVDIIHHLIHQVEVSVRQSLAEHLVDLEAAPHSLVALLADDQIDVAYPLLVHSNVLKDAELIEIVRHRTMEHQLAIAMRANVSEPLSDALVATENVEVVTALLENPGSQISPGTLSSIVGESRYQPAYHAPLSTRHDLSPELATKLCVWVSTALRQHIMDNFEIDPIELDRAIETAAQEVIEAETAAIREMNGRPKPPARPAETPASALLEPLGQGDVARFMDCLAELTGLSLTMVRRVVFEPGGEGLAIACKAIGVDQATFAAIFLRSRAGRLGDKQVEHAELFRAMSFYENVDADSAWDVLNRWETDPSFLTAMSRAKAE